MRISDWSSDVCSSDLIAYPGDLIGTRAFLRNGRHRTTAEALSEVRLCRIPGIEARRLMHDHPALHQRLVRVCLDSLDASQEAMSQAAAMSNRDRLFQDRKSTRLNSSH